ncbi:MAG: transcriptional regulator [Candidatus Lokiarchaeota archaeon]
MWLELLKSILTENFGDKLKEIISKLGMNILEFSEESRIPEGTLYKLISDNQRDFKKSTLVAIIKGIRKLEGYSNGDFIGIITTRGALDSLGKFIEFKNEAIKIKEYPSTTIEEEIINGVRAEKEGAKGLVCGPIAASTLEKVVDIPITSLRFEEGPLINSIDNLLKKL